MNCQFTVNGQRFVYQAKGDEKLLDTLRTLGFYEVKKGCERGNCGACVVLIDGIPKNSCLLYTIQMEGRDIRTVKGIDAGVIQQSLVDAGAVQCGYCTPGIVLSTYALIQHTKNPGEDDIKDALDGHLCRCTGYKKILDGVTRAVHILNSQGGI